MKKIYFFLFPLLLAITQPDLKAQNAFFDAQYLTKLDNDQIDLVLALPEDILTNDEIAELTALKYVLEFDLANVDHYPKFDIIMSALKKFNSYRNKSGLFEDYTAMVAIKSGSVAPGLFAINSLKLPTGLGAVATTGTDVITKVIDGVTKYYAEEFKKAKTTAYINLFENTVGKYGDLQIIFPKTYEKLKTIDPAKLVNLGGEMKDIFKSDLKNLIFNLQKHINDNTANTFNGAQLHYLNSTNTTTIKNSPYFVHFNIIATISDKLINKIHPADLFNYLDDKYYIADAFGKLPRTEYKIYGNVFHAINLIQTSLRDTNKMATTQFNNVWINHEQISKLDGESAKYFVFLLYISDKSFFNSFIPASIDFTVAADVELFIEDYIKPALNTLNEIQDFRKTHQEKIYELRLSDYIGLFKNIIFSNEQFKNTVFSIIPDANKKNTLYYFDLFDKITQIYSNIENEKYDNVIYNSVSILNDIIGISENKNTDKTLIVVLKKMSEYGAFMADVIKAESSDDIKEVIKRFASPSGSYVEKRSSAFTLSLSGHPGYFVGFEKLKSTSNDKCKFQTGITLPIGLETTIKLNPNNKNSSSISLFTQAVDIGAILNYRLDDETSDLPEKITLAQIFSPGVSINYGVANSAVAFGLGYQYTPKLRSVTSEGSGVLRNGNRFFLRISCDIPTLYLYKSKSKHYNWPQLN
jgi:hypothetical protein